MDDYALLLHAIFDGIQEMDDSDDLDLDEPAMPAFPPYDIITRGDGWEWEYDTGGYEFWVMPEAQAKLRAKLRVSAIDTRVRCKAPVTTEDLAFIAETQYYHNNFDDTLIRLIQETNINLNLSLNKYDNLLTAMVRQKGGRLKVVRALINCPRFNYVDHVQAAFQELQEQLNIHGNFGAKHIFCELAAKTRQLVAYQQHCDGVLSQYLAPSGCWEIIGAYLPVFTAQQLQAAPMQTLLAVPEQKLPQLSWMPCKTM